MSNPDRFSRRGFLAVVARRGNDGTHELPIVAPMSMLNALLDARHKRASPIVMRTIAMGAGMVLIAFGWGAADGSFRCPMAVAVIGGLITSTFLSWLVVPAVYTFMDDVEHGLARLFKRKPEAAKLRCVDTPA